MSIRGSLREASLPDVLQLISMGRKTGGLSLSHRGNLAHIYFDSGDISYASIVNRRPRVADVGAHVEETVYLLCTWHDGTFQFDPTARPETTSVVSINPHSLLLEAARRMDEWTLIEKSVPTLDCVFEVMRAAAARATLTNDQQRVLEHVNGTSDVTGVANASGLSEFEVGKAIHEMVVAGVMRPASTRSKRDIEAPQSARVDEHRNLGVAFFRTGMFDEAAREFRRVLELKPDDAAARQHMALALLKYGAWEEAATALEEMAAQPDARASTCHNLGLALERLGRYVEARDALVRAADLPGGDDPRIATSLGVVALLMGDAPSANHAFTTARGRFESHPPANWYHYAALAAAWLGQLPRAQKLLEEGIRLYPRASALHNNLAALLERHGKYNDALATAEQGTAENDGVPQLHKNVGDLYYRAGRYDDALAAYDRSVKANSRPGSDVYVKLGNINLKRGKRDEAAACWERALELNPDNAIVRRNLDSIRQLAAGGAR